MSTRLSILLCIMGLCGAGVTTVSQAQGLPCSSRYPVAFAHAAALGIRSPDQATAYTEVMNAFSPRPEVCEPGGYQAFLDAFGEFAHQAMRAPVKQREGMVRVAIATATQGPLHVPAEEVRKAVSLYRQTRSDLYSTADDAGMTPLLRSLLDAFDRAGAPTPAPAPPPAQPAPDGPKGDVQTVRVPQTPLSSAAVVALYEARELLRQRNIPEALARLELVIRYLEASP